MTPFDRSPGYWMTNSLKQNSGLRNFGLPGRAILAITIVLLLGGCGNKGDTPTGRRTLKLVHFYMDQKELWQKTVEAFAAQHPELDVTLEAIPYGLYTTKIQSAAAAGTPLADVVLIDDWFGQDLFRRDYTLPLDSLFDRDLKREDFYTRGFTVWRKGNLPDRPLMAMPACEGVTALFYNQKIFDWAAIPYPDSTWTYDTLLRVAQEITARQAKGGSGTAGNATRGEKIYGLVVDDGGSTAVDTYIYSNGGSILTADLNGSALVAPPTILAFTAYVDLVRRHGVALAPDPSQSMGQRFAHGNIAMMLNLDVAKEELRAVDFPWNLTVPPRGVAGMKSRGSGQAFGIARSSRVPEAAWQLIKHIVTVGPKEGINELYHSAMPLYRPLANSAGWLEGTPRCDRRALLKVADGDVFTLITPGWQEWRDHGFVPNLQDMLAGRVSVEEGLRRADKAVSEVLSRHRER